MARGPPGWPGTDPPWLLPLLTPEGWTCACGAPLTGMPTDMPAAPAPETPREEPGGMPAPLRLWQC